MILEENKDLHKLVGDMSQKINDFEREAQNRKDVDTETDLKNVMKDKRLLLNGKTIVYYYNKFELIENIDKTQKKY